jgi:hypothetical protein
VKVRVVVVVVPVHGAGGVGGALASPFGDGEDDGMVVQEENTERLHEVGNGGHHQGSTWYVMGGGGGMFQEVSDGWGDGMVVQEEYSHTGKDSMRYVMGGIR